MPRRSVPIRQLPSGLWQVRYRDGDGRQRATTFATERLGRQFLDRTRADLSRGTWIDPDDSSTTFRSYAEAWVAAQPWAPGTRMLVESNLRGHLYPAIGDVPLGRIRRSQLQGLVSALAGRLEASTIRVVVQHLRQVLNGAVQDRMLVENPAVGLRVPRGRPAEVVIPPPEVVEAILGAIDGRSRGLVAVGAGLGLRQGEAFGLSLDRIDFLRRTVTIDRQLVRLARGSALAAPKTERSYRTIPLPNGVGLELARHVERFPSDDPDGLIFQAALGGRLRRDGWNRRTWKPAVELVGRPELTFHALRHFYASALIRAGQQAPTVARRLGNSPQMVLSTYAHLWRDDDDRTRGAIDNLLPWHSATAADGG